MFSALPAEAWRALGAHPLRTILAMLGAIAGLISKEGVRIEDAEAVAVSFPGFFDLIDSVAQR